MQHFFSFLRVDFYFHMQLNFIYLGCFGHVWGLHLDFFSCLLLSLAKYLTVDALGLQFTNIF